MFRRKSLAFTAAATVLASLGLVACDRNETASRNADTTTARIEQSGQNAAERADRAADRTADKAREVGSDMSQATKSAAADVGDKVSDAVITTSVNAELAKDAALSALKINVDTSNGKVVLRGTAPDSSAKGRATKLAQAVKGVTSVDNQLTIAAAKS